MKLLASSLCVLALTPLTFAQDVEFSQQAKGLLGQLKRETAISTAPIGNLAVAGAAALQGVQQTLKCAQVPAVSDAINFRDDAYLLDRDLAGTLKISYIGTVNGDADKASKVFVREFSKFANCPSTDGTGTVLYGASIRATVLIDSTDANGSVNFAIAAASATVKSRSVQVRVEGLGFQDQQIQVASSQAQQVTQSGLKVENYNDFNKALSQAFDLAVKSNIVAMQVVGFTPNGDSKLIATGIASTWALDRIAQGYGCNEAVSSFNQIFPNQVSQSATDTINGVYTSIVGGCGVTNPIFRASADAILNGQRLRKK